MGNLYATITYDHHAGHTSRTGHRWILTTAETWMGKVKVCLEKDGSCYIRITDKHDNHIATILDANPNKIVKNQTQFKVIPVAKLATGFVPNHE